MGSLVRWGVEGGIIEVREIPIVCETTQKWINNLRELKTKINLEIAIEYVRLKEALTKNY